jgi:hypothetical protein
MQNTPQQPDRSAEQHRAAQKAARAQAAAVANYLMSVSAK